MRPKNKFAFPILACMLTNFYTVPIVMGFYLVIGALLTYFGYFH